jgi:methyltransferase
MTLWTTLFLAYLVVQRLGELVLARRNTQRLMRRGAREVGAGHYPLIVALHTSWIACLVVFGHDQPVAWIWLVVFVVLQVLRYWILATLGERWTTRIIVIDEPLVARGPFRYVRHPNYLLVVAEIAVAPIVLGLVWVAVVFSLANAAILVVRISAEEAALQELRQPSEHSPIHAP